MEADPNANRLKRPLQVLLALLAAVLVAFWLFFTPTGLSGKADAVGYAVCHQIPERTFQFDGHHMPLCARCTGMHLGALFGLIYHLFQGRRGSLPPKRFLFILGLFLLGFAVDGLNSFIGLSGFLPQLYPSSNLLRLVTGTFLGFAIAAILFPIFNQTMWHDWIAQPALRTWKQMGFVVLVCAGIIGLVLTGDSLLLTLFSALSILNVIVILTAIHSILWVVMLKKENRFANFSQLKSYILCGFITVVLQIALMDYIRLSLTGTWGSLY